ncbi:unnamed protein product [Paramecium pentaurelia]|nr:unnamed protein product [Paramecium pentaurelia]
MCEKFSLYCQYTDRCQTKQCSELYTEQVCRYYNCEWNKNTKECNDKLKCDTYQTQEDCNLSSYDNIQCSWLENDDDESFCTQLGCQFLDKYQSCRNQFINNNICVKLKDESCVQCEEIKELCLCIDQEYCKFNPQLNQCQSINCNNFINENQCLKYHFCEYNQENQACHFHCANHKNDIDCDQHSLYCYWNYELQICMQPEITTQVIVDPILNIENTSLFISFSMLVCILW